jgi:hypothetical protein
MLNRAARERLHEQRELGTDVAVRTERGVREFADNDRILFLKNERDLGVKNGSLGQVEKVEPDRLAVRLDDGRRISVDLKTYAHIDHGYAATVHKTQGMTVDRTHVLATPGLDAHASYVALSRHRDGTALHYGRDDLADEAALRHTLARERPKDMALDYERRASSHPSRWQPATDARTGNDGGPTTPREQPGGLAALVSRVFGRTGDERMVAPDPAREASGDRAADRGGGAVREPGKDPAAARVSPAMQRNGADASRGADPANSDHAKALRAMMAAREHAPRQTAGSIREALAAAKKAPGISRDQDYGAER